MSTLLGFIAKVSAGLVSLHGGIPGMIFSTVMFLWALADIYSVISDFF